MDTSIERVAQIAQEQIDREAANNPVVRKALDVVEDFLKKHKVMCYGGTAINNLLPPEDRFYNPDLDVPDYDFFSETPQLHAAKIADRLTDMGYSSVEVKPGVHLGTFKVFADYIGVADITHLDNAIFERLWQEKVSRAGIHYVPPNFLRMSVYLELSRPKGDVSRWKKVYSRLQLLNKHYPMTCPSKDLKINEKYLDRETKSKIENIIINEKAILLGFNAAALQKQKQAWAFPIDVLVVPEDRDKISKEFMKVLETKVKREDRPAYHELMPAHTDIDDAKTGDTIIRIYETHACHSFHKTTHGLMLASIPTLLQFFLSVLYAPKHYLEEQPEQRFLCTAQELVEMANDNMPRRYKLLTPLSCMGSQKTMIDMRIEKSDLYEKLSKNKSSPEFLEFFFTYTPTSLDKTRRRKVREQLHKTIKNRGKYN
jgi:hypothetical protein